MTTRTKPQGKSALSPLAQRLEALAAENAELKLKLDEAKHQERVAIEAYADFQQYVPKKYWPVQIEGEDSQVVEEDDKIGVAADVERGGWPHSLTYMQKLHQLGYLVAAILTDPEIAEPVHDALQGMVTGISEQLAVQDWTQRLALESHHLLPAAALALGKAEQKNG